MIHPKVIVIGIDGASWNLIKYLVKKGELPTFKYLMENGAWGELKSTVPSITFPAWESIFTGQNPGDFGIFDFVGVDVKNNKFSINTPNKFKSIPIWTILNEYGYKTCMINIPTAKVRKVNGVIVGGPFSEENTVYPHNYKSVLENMNYEFYPKELTKSFMESSNNPPPLHIIRKTIVSRFKLVDYIIINEKPDFVAFVIFIIDNIQHFYWGEQIVYDTWKIIDKELGKFVSKYKKSLIILVSDHGFTKLSKIFYISTFLEKIGFIKYRKRFLYKILNKITVNDLINLSRKMKIDEFLLKFTPKRLLLSVLSNFPTDDGRFGVKSLSRIIDWEKSKCIPIGQAIYLNCSLDEKEQIINILKNEFKKLNKVVKRIYLKEDIYFGNHLENAPDIMIEPMPGVMILESPYFKKIIVDANKDLHKWKGVHTSNGIILFYGKGIKRVNINATVYDITPTILYIFGINPPKYMRGKILKDVVEGIKIDHINNAESYKLRYKIKNLKSRMKLIKK